MSHNFSSHFSPLSFALLPAKSDVMMMMTTSVKNLNFQLFNLQLLSKNKMFESFFNKCVEASCKWKTTGK